MKVRGKASLSQGMKIQGIGGLNERVQESNCIGPGIWSYLEHVLFAIQSDERFGRYSRRR